MEKYKTALCECGRVVFVRDGKFVIHTLTLDGEELCPGSQKEPTFLQSYKYSPDGTSSKDGRR